MLKKWYAACSVFVLSMLFSPAVMAMSELGPEERKFAYLAAGIGLGLAVIGGAIGQGKAAGAALEGISRNPGAQPKIFTAMIISLALIESLVIYSLVISIMLVGK